MTSKSAADITLDEIYQSKVLLYLDENQNKVIMCSPSFDFFQCGSCKKIMSRSTYGNHYSNRWDKKADAYICLLYTSDAADE